MKLLISRDTSNVSAAFQVYDECEYLLFDISGKYSSAVRKLKALTKDGKCVMKISATPELAGKLAFNVLTADSAFVVTIRLKAEVLSLKVHGAKLFFRGNLLERCFEITDVSSKVLAIHKPEPGKRGRYTLEIFDEAQLVSLLGVAICADLLSFSDSAAVCRA